MNGLLHDVFVQTMVLRWLATVFAGLVLAALTLLVLRLSTDEARKLWLSVRGKTPVVINQVDEASDPVNVKLDQLLDRLKPADWASMAAMFLPVFVQSLADGLDKVLKVGVLEESLPPDPLMGARIRAVCSRCGTTIDGFEIPGAGTAGFYRVDEGLWSKYANPGETIICDTCMQRDERYRADYPGIRPLPEPETIAAGGPFEAGHA